MHTMFFLLIYTPLPANSLQAELGPWSGKSGPQGPRVTATHRTAAHKSSSAGSHLPKYSISDETLDSKDLGKTMGKGAQGHLSEHPVAASTLPSSPLMPAWTFLPQSVQSLLKPHRYSAPRRCCCNLASIHIEPAPCRLPLMTPASVWEREEEFLSTVSWPLSSRSQTQPALLHPTLSSPSLLLAEKPSQSLDHPMSQLSAPFPAVQPSL